MSKIYTFEFKKKLKDRIEKITDKKTLEKIRDIIFKYNPKVNVSQNSSGMLLFFHNLNEFTYNRLDYFLNKLDNDKIKVLTASYTDTQEDIKIKINDKNNIKLSSIEKNLIKKKDYYDKLQEENNCESDDIFLDKDSLSATYVTVNNNKTKTTNKK